MESLNVCKYIQKYLFCKDPKIITFIHFIEKYCKDLEKQMLDQQTQPNMLKLLYEYLYVLDVVYKHIGLLSLLYKNPDLLEANKKIESFQSNFFANESIYEKLIKIKGIEPTIMNKFKLKQNINIDEIRLKIRSLERDIYSQLVAPNNVPMSRGIKLSLKNVPNSINLNRQNYYHLQRNIDNAREREIIEHCYISNTNLNDALHKLALLVIERNKFAVLSGKPTFFSLVKKSALDENTIKSDIEDLVKKIDGKSRKEIDRIYRKLSADKFDKKVDANDIVYYCEHLTTRVTFQLSHIIHCVRCALNKYFKIELVETQDTHIWNANVICFEVKFESKLLGLCYVDLQKTETKSMTSPISIHLSQRRGNSDVTRVAIIGNYPNFEKKIISLSDTIYLFREFGCAIQMLAHESSNGLFIENKEFCNLMQQIMECVLWEKSTIKMLCEQETIENVVDCVLFTRHLNFAYTIKMKCINALFDYVLHNSLELIKIIKSANTNDYKQIMFSVYKKIYQHIMFSQQDILNTNISGINPIILQQEINGSEGLIYCNIYTEILSFGIFQLVKNGNGLQFVQTVLKSYPQHMKKKLDEFLDREDSYDAYLKELIGYAEIDTEINNQINHKLNPKQTSKRYFDFNNTSTNTLPTIIESSANMFDDSDHSNDNMENIIRIDKRPTLI